jgi:hypothetical protein
MLAELLEQFDASRHSAQNTIPRRTAQFPLALLNSCPDTCHITFHRLAVSLINPNKIRHRFHHRRWLGYITNTSRNILSCSEKVVERQAYV